MPSRFLLHSQSPGPIKVKWAWNVQVGSVGGLSFSVSAAGYLCLLRRLQSGRQAPKASRASVAGSGMNLRFGPK